MQPGTVASGTSRTRRSCGASSPGSRSSGSHVWIGDEAWEIDHVLHENPELKTAAYVLLTDFVGYLPMQSAIHGSPTVPYSSAPPRTSSPGASVPDCRRSAPGPSVTTPSSATYRASTPQGSAARQHLGPNWDCRRTRLSASPPSGARQQAPPSSGASARLAGEREPGLQMLAVAGPRIDPTTIPQLDGVEVRGYVGRPPIVGALWSRSG